MLLLEMVKHFALPFLFLFKFEEIHKGEESSPDECFGPIDDWM
jgi:hypothetical protein